MNILRASNNSIRVAMQLTMIGLSLGRVYQFNNFRLYSTNNYDKRLWLIHDLKTEKAAIFESPKAAINVYLKLIWGPNWETDINNRKINL